MRCRLYVPDGAPDAQRTILFLHGGGFVFGDVDTHDGQARRLANRTGSAVLAVDYRRPPEHPFPAAPDDVDTALSWLLVNAAAPRPGPVPGGRVRGQRRREPRAGRRAAQPERAGRDRAGLPLRRRGDGLPVVRRAGRWADPRPRRPGTGSSTPRDPRTCWTPTSRRTSPPASTPSRRRWCRSPSTTCWPTRTSSWPGGSRPRARSVEVTTYPGMIHGFWRNPQLFDAAEEALAEIAGFLDRHV